MRESSILLITLIIYFAVIMGIGLAAATKRKRGVSDYYLGDKNLGPFLMIMTMAASWFSIAGFIGVPAFAFIAGPDYMVYGMWNLLIALGMWIVGTRAWLLSRRFGYITPTQLYSSYYGGNTVPVLAIIIFLLAIVPQALVQVTGAGQSVLGLTGIPYGLGVLLFAVTVGIYTIFGGLRAVVWTDAFQGSLMLLVGLFMPIAIIALGHGPGPLFATIARTDPSVLQFQKPYVGSSISQFVEVGLGFLGMPYIFQRFFMARSPKVLAQSFVGAATLQTWIFALTSVVFGIAGAGFFTLKGLHGNADLLVPMFFARYFPVIGAIVIAAAFAHGNSAISAIMLTGSSIFSVDLYKKYFRPTASEVQVKRAGQWFIVAYGVLLLVLAFTHAGGALIALITAVGFGLALQVLPAMMGPLFWPRITRAGAGSGMLVGLVSAIVFQALPATTLPWGLLPGIVALVLNLAVTWGVSLATKPLPYSVQESFHGYLDSYLYQASLSAPSLQN